MINICNKNSLCCLYTEKKNKTTTNTGPRNKEWMCFLISHFSITRCYIDPQETRQKKGILIHFVFCASLFIFLELFDHPGFSSSIYLWLYGLFLKIGSIYQNAISPALLNFLQKNTRSLKYLPFLLY